MAKLPNDDDIKNQIRARYPNHFSQAEGLFEFAHQAFGEFKGKIATPYERAILLMAAKALKSYHAVVKLCEIAHMEDAGLILRSLFNLLVILRWVSQRNTEQRARKYLGWFWVAMNDELELVGARIDPKVAKFVRENYLVHKHLFEYRDPKGSVKCHRKWHEPEVRSIEQMANEVDLKDHYDGLYRPLSGIEHSDAVAYIGMIPTDPTSSETPKINLYPDMFVVPYLRNAFQYFGEILNVWNKVFKIGDAPRLSEVLESGIQFFKGDMP